MDKTQFSQALKNIFTNTLHIDQDLLTEVNTSRIYHYTSPQGFLGIMRDNACANLRFSKYNSLNDREESLDIVNHIKLYSKSIPEKDTTKDFIKFIENFELGNKTYITSTKNSSTILRTEECDTYLCCFSQKDDLLPMWNYYSKSKHYEGYSIGFSSKYFKSESCWGKGYSIELQKVIYSNKEKNDILSCLFKPLEKIYHQLDNEQRNQVKDILQSYINKFQFLFKNPCFSHEEEVRAILKIPKNFIYEDTMLKKDFCESHGYIVPYIEFKDLNHAVKSVRIAPLYEKELAVANLQEFFNERKYKNIDIKTSSIPIRF